MNELRIAALVVVYNYSYETLQKNIKTYLNQVGRIYIVDNSDEALSQEWMNDPRIRHIDMKGNKGIAAANNRGFEEAIKEGFEYVLTFDQDSRVEAEYVNKLSSFLELELNQKIGILAPFVFWNASISHRKTDRNKYLELDSVINSGSLISVDAFKSVKGYCEKLFVDLFDIDFCFRLREVGWKIIQLENLNLRHQLGDCRDIRLFKKHLFYIENHNQFRTYYKIRNSVLLLRRFKNKPQYRSFFQKFFLAQLFKTLIFQNNRLKHLKSIFKGLSDSRNISL